MESPSPAVSAGLQTTPLPVETSTAGYPGIIPERDGAGMSESGQEKQLRLGFLETIEIDGRGHIGGLLVTNHSGRPLEFQCTTPVRPNRTQEILFGETLRPWLLGELIGSTLLERVSIKPGLVITSDPSLLELQNHTTIPVALAEAQNDAVAHSLAGDEAASAAVPATRCVRVGNSLLRFHQGHNRNAESLERQQHLVPESANLQEPLERVREALAETVRTVFSR